MRQPYRWLILALGLALLLVADWSWGQEKLISLPPEIHGKPGKFVFVVAETNGKAVSWSVLTVDEKVVIVPFDKLVNPKELILVAPAGRYKLEAHTCIDDKPYKTSTWLIIGDEVPDPPLPPDPPPPPTDPLATKLKNALAKDGPVTNKHLVGNLVPVALATSKSISTFATVGDVQKYWSDQSRGVAGITGILSVRQEVNNYLVSQIPWPQSTVLDADKQNSVAATFMKLAIALEEAAK